MRHCSFSATFKAGFLAVLACFGLTCLNGWSETPALPKSLHSNNPGKLVLLDFYSDYCGTCRMMAPKLKEMQRKLGEQIEFRHINVAEAADNHFWDEFKLHGTPTYVLYDQQGQPIYKMEDLITPLILGNQLSRMTGNLKQVSFPAELPLPVKKAADPNDLGQLVLVSFENEACQDCRQMQPYLQGFEISGLPGLKVLHVDTEKPSSQKLMADMGIKKLPAYALFDYGRISAEDQANHRLGTLFLMSGKVQPKLLWDVIRMFGISGV